MNPFAILDSV